MSFYRNHTCTRAQNCSELALGLNSDWWLPQCGVGLEGICEREKEESVEEEWDLDSCRMAQLGKNLPAKAGDAKDSSSISGSGRSPGEENGNPLQYSCLENPTDRGAWPATVHGVTKSWT